MKRNIAASLCTGILCASILTTGCGGSANGGSNSSNADASGSSAESSYDMSMAETPSADTMDGGSIDEKAQLQTEAGMAAGAQDDAMDEADSSEPPLNGSDTSTVKSQNQKLIYTYNYSVETKDFDSFYEKVSKKTEQVGGYVESSETSGSISDGINRNANLTLRIPADQMQQIISFLDSDSNVTYQSRSSENVTLQYVDTQSHLKALRVEQETLMQLMEKADKLKDVIALQSQLTQIRYEIESYESQLRTYDNLVEYSTLYLSITEVERTTNVATSKTSFFEEISSRFSDNLYAVGQWLRATAIWLISSVPILLPLAAMITAAVLLAKRKFGRRYRYAPVQSESDAIRTDTEKSGTEKSDSGAETPK